MNPDNKTWWRSRSVLTAAVVVVLALVVGGGLLVRHQNDRGRLPVGATRKGDFSLADGHFSGNYHFLVPGAMITVNLETGRRASHHDYSTDDSTRFKAPRDGLLVQVDARANSNGGAETKYVGAHKVTTDEPSVIYTGGHGTKLSLRSKGSSVALDPALVPKDTRSSDSDDDSRARMIAVRGALSDLELVATFRGHSQSISLLSGRRAMGDFASLYGVDERFTRPTPIEHNGPALVGGAVRSTSKALVGGMFRMPYLDGLGWAPAGREWILIEQAGYTSATDAATWADGDSSASYTSTKTPTTRITVNGGKPVKRLSEPGVDSRFDLISVASDSVFSVPKGDAVTVDARADLPLKRTAGGDSKAPARLTLKLHTDVSYPAVTDLTERGQR